MRCTLRVSYSKLRLDIVVKPFHSCEVSLVAWENETDHQKIYIWCHQINFPVKSMLLIYKEFPLWKPSYFLSKWSQNPHVLLYPSLHREINLEISIYDILMIGFVFPMLLMILYTNKKVLQQCRIGASNTRPAKCIASRSKLKLFAGFLLQLLWTSSNMLCFFPRRAKIPTFGA